MTSVEWLIEQIKNDQNQKALSSKEWMEVIEQAKEMEREQMASNCSQVISYDKIWEAALNYKTMNEFDKWRSNYERMTLKEQIEYHNDIEARYPEQAHYTLQNVFDCFSIVGNGANILEFGCWKGDLAQICIPKFEVKEWLGIEICVSAIEKTKCDNPNFKYWLPDDFNWFETTKRKDGFDFVIATHFIEHLSNQHFDSLVKYCNGVKHIYFEAPLSNQDQYWDGYIGTHKLNYGWQNVESKMLSAGYEIKLNFQEGKLFEKLA